MYPLTICWVQKKLISNINGNSPLLHLPLKANKSEASQPKSSDETTIMFHVKMSWCQTNWIKPVNNAPSQKLQWIDMQRPCLSKPQSSAKTKAPKSRPPWIKWPSSRLCNKSFTKRQPKKSICPMITSSLPTVVVQSEFQKDFSVKISHRSSRDSKLNRSRELTKLLQRATHVRISSESTDHQARLAQPTNNIWMGLKYKLQTPAYSYPKSRPPPCTRRSP